MKHLFQAMSLIALLQSLADSTWQVFHHTGDGELDEDTEAVGEGTLTIKQAGFGFSATGAYTVDGVGHTLIGKAQVVNLSVRETITHDGAEVAKDDLYVSSHIKESDEDRRVIVEYRFKSADGTNHKFRFKKSLGE